MYSIEKSKHTKTGEDIWIVKLSLRLEPDEFKKVNAEIKSKGGRYYKMFGGYVFKKDPTEILGQEDENKIKDHFEITFYKTQIDDSASTEILYTGDSIEKAKEEAELTENTNKIEEATVSIFKRTDKYKFVGEKEFDPEIWDSIKEMIEDYPIDDNYEDSDYYELIEEGEFEILDQNTLEGSEKTAQQLENEVNDYLSLKYNRKYGFYNPIIIGEKKDGSNYTLMIRVKDHSENPNNRNKSISDDYLSIVVANKDATSKRFHSSKELYFTGGSTIEEIKESIKEYIQNIIDNDSKIIKLDNNLIDLGYQLDNNKEELEGGLADGKNIEDIADMHNIGVGYMESQLRKGISVEKEHTSDPEKAKEIALDHLYESPRYYEELEKMEDQELKYKVGDTVMYYQDDSPSVIKEIEDGKYVLEHGNSVIYTLASEDQVELIESVRSEDSEIGYQLGDMWSSDFDYEGMLKKALEIETDNRMGLNKLLDSLSDVNYHTIAKHLNNYLVEDDMSKAQTLYEEFISSVYDEIESDGLDIEIPKRIKYTPKYQVGDKVDWFKNKQYSGYPATVVAHDEKGVAIQYSDSDSFEVSYDEVIPWRGYRKHIEGDDILTTISEIEDFPKYEFDTDLGEFFFETEQDREKAIRQVMKFNEEKADTTDEKSVEPVLAGDKLSSQDRINKEVRELLERKGLSRHLYTHSDFMLLSQYTGDTKTQGDKKDGYIWDYYTPDEAVKLCWQLAYKYGFRPTGSIKVLESSCGVGRFLRYVPDYCKVKAYEIDDISFKISKLLYPKFDIVNDSFESHFYVKKGLKDFDNKAIWDTYNLVIGNPPYMYPYTSVYKDKEKRTHQFIKSLEQMFMARGVDCLEPNGLLIYIIPSSIVDNSGSFGEFKDYLSSKTNMLDLLRLPSGTFKNTDITTDIVVLQKK